jgi:hypothetical protein
MAQHAGNLLRPDLEPAGGQHHHHGHRGHHPADLAEKRETAARLRGRIEKVLDAAKVKGHRTGDNPARWRGHIELVMPKKKRGESASATTRPCPRSKCRTSCRGSARA